MRHPRLALSLLSTLLLCTLAHAQPTELEIDRSAGPARVWLQGEPGREYTIEGSTDLENWGFLVTTVRTNGPQPVPWFDAESMLMPQRFYRAVKLDPAPPVPGDDFRLIDHQGKSRALNYYLADTNARAMVLIFTGNGCSNVQQMVTTIKGLTNQFRPPAVRFYLIDANAADNRSNILAEAIALGLSNGPPILHDRAQLVARAYGATKTPEAVALRKNTNENFEVEWSIFYRGAIDDRLGPSPVATTQRYLSNALTSFLANGPVAPIQTQPRGCDVTFNPQPSVSYSADIAPMIQDKCVRCHSPGNIAPIAFLDYDDVSVNALQIRVEVLAGRMPPWHADPIYSTFSNDASLTPEQAAKLVQWIDEGAPRGGGPDPLANPPPPPADWPLGTPDYILSIPSQDIPATGEVPYRYLSVSMPANFPSNAWLRAVGVKPGNRKVVHHVLVFVESHNAGNNLGGLGGFFAGYVPGYADAPFPDGTGKQLYRTNTLEFQMHYTTTGSPETDQTQIGLYLAPSQPPRELQTRSSFKWGGLAVGPRVEEQPVSSTTYQHTFARDAYLYEMSPHMHLRGSRFRYEAVYPGGAREILLSVPFYEFHWQTLYRLATPKFLPAGTRIECFGAWDNSPMNPENPNPNASVSFGEQTDDEMFIGFFNAAEIP